MKRDSSSPFVDPGPGAGSPAANVQSGDRDLIDRCAAGNRSAWVELVGRFDGKVLRAVSRTCGQTCPDDVEDVRQEVWSRLWRDDHALLRSLRAGHEHSLPSFLAVMARTCALDHLKARRIRPSAAPSPDAEGALESDAPTPEDHAAAQRWSACLAETLRLVAAQGAHPGRDGDILRLHYEEGYSATEIAAMGVGLPLDGVESVLRRTRDKIERTAREQLGETPAGPAPAPSSERPSLPAKAPRPHPKRKPGDEPP